MNGFSTMLGLILFSSNSLFDDTNKLRKMFVKLILVRSVTSDLSSKVKIQV